MIPAPLLGMYGTSCTSCMLDISNSGKLLISLNLLNSKILYEPLFRPISNPLSFVKTETLNSIIYYYYYYNTLLMVVMFVHIHSIHTYLFTLRNNRQQGRPFPLLLLHTACCIDLSFRVLTPLSYYGAV